MSLQDDLSPIVPPKKTRNLLRKKRGEEVAHPADPRAELRRLVWQHKRWTNDARILSQMVGDRTIARGTPEEKLVKCDKDPGDVVNIKLASDALKRRASSLETGMLVQLRQLPVWKLFLDKVFGCGPVGGAYLLAFVDIRRAMKPSQLIRYCGNALDSSTGRLERRVAGPKYAVDKQGKTVFNAEAGGTFNAELRTRVWQVMIAMRKNSAKATRCEAHAAVRPASSAKKEIQIAFRAECAGCSACLATPSPFGTTSKYLQRWADAVHTQTSFGQPMRGDPKGRVANSERKGRMKATDLFLEDLYMVMRAEQGLEVWPTFATIKRGYAHGGAPSAKAPTAMSLDEALELVGDVSGRPATSFQFDVEAEDEEEREMDEAAE